MHSLSAHNMLITHFNSNMSVSAQIDDVNEFKWQIKVLQMEKDATYEEVKDFRKRLYHMKKDNQHLKAILTKLGQEMVKKGYSIEDNL